MKIHVPIWELEEHCTPDILSTYAACAAIELEELEEQAKQAKNKKKVTRKTPGRRPKGRK